ncbi:MAG: hypothetical protein WCL14_06205 [Bacteroidota bacterium]
MNNNPKKILFGILLLALFLPMLQQGFNFIEVKPLKGAIVNAKDTSFSMNGWLNATYQTTKEKFLNDNFGLRNIFIRINNQIAFDVDNLALANGMIIGKNNYLYEEGVIKSYLGDDLCQEKSLNDQLGQLKDVHDSLKRRGIDLIVVAVPNKAFFYPEFIPDRYGKKKKNSNYEYMSDTLKKMDIPYLDLNSYFIENKHKSAYPLYPQYGHHWSDYGCDTSTVILVKFIEKLRNIEMPTIKYDTIVTGFDYLSSDYDIAAGMNLLMSLNTFKMGYPVMSFKDQGKAKPDVLTIGDSFYWGIYGTGRAGLIFNKYSFWYYFHELHCPGNPILQTGDIDLKEEIEKHQIVMIMANPLCFNQLGWGFIEAAYKLYHQNNGISHGPPKAINQKLNDIITSIRNTASWYNEIVKKAESRKIPVDSMLKMDAMWMLENAK